MEDIGENIKFIKEDEEVLLKLNHKNSAIFFSILLTARGMDFRYISVYDEDDSFYDPDEEEEVEYLFWIGKDAWKDLKGDICWEKE